MKLLLATLLCICCAFLVNAWGFVGVNSKSNLGWVRCGSEMSRCSSQSDCCIGHSCIPYGYERLCVRDVKKRFDPRMNMEDHSYGDDSNPWDSDDSSSEEDSGELSGPGMDCRSSEDCQEGLCCIRLSYGKWRDIRMCDICDDK